MSDGLILSSEIGRLLVLAWEVICLGAVRLAGWHVLPESFGSARNGCCVVRLSGLVCLGGIVGRSRRRCHTVRSSEVRATWNFSLGFGKFAAKWTTNIFGVGVEVAHPKRWDVGRSFEISSCRIEPVLESGNARRPVMQLFV